MAGWEFSITHPRSLLEVYSVIIFSDYIDDISGAEIEGRVHVEDNFHEFDLFNSKDGGDIGQDSILPDGTLCLTGPFRCLVCPQGRVELSLQDKHRKLQLCHGGFDMSPYVDCVPHDKRFTSLVPGRDGFALVHSVLFSCAVEAIVEVSFVTDMISRPAAGTGFVYGYIHARNDLCGDEDSVCDSKFFRSTLFNASKQKPKEPNAATKILSLSRSIVAVPVKSRLIIDARLYDAKTEDIIVDDTAYFAAATSGLDSKRIGGIMVKVNWLVDPFSTPGAVRPCLNKSGRPGMKRLSGAISSNQSLNL